MTKHILLVEDNSYERLRIVSFLTERGYSVEYATCMKEAQQKLETSAPDFELIVSDYHFPHRENETPRPLGIEILTMLRVGVYPTYESVPFILHTSDDSVAVTSRTKELGGEYCLKRFDLSLFSLLFAMERLTADSSVAVKNAAE